MAATEATDRDLATAREEADRMWAADDGRKIATASTIALYYLVAACERQQREIDGLRTRLDALEPARG